MNIFHTLTKYNTILTPNRRLSAVLKKEYANWQQTNGKKTWETPDILPYTAWLQRLWESFTLMHMEPHPILLNSLQENSIWHTILALGEKTKNNTLLHISETVKSIQTAWLLLKQWQISLNHPLFALSEESRIFQQWATQFEQNCAQKNWIDQQSIAEYLNTQIKHKKIRPTEHILLIGFTEI